MIYLRMLLPLLAFLWQFKAIAGTKNDLAEPHKHQVTFVQISDTHFFSSAKSRERGEQIVQAINRLSIPIDCVIITGDIVVNADIGWDIAKNIFNKLKAPWHVLAGNHDITKLPVDAKKYLAAFNELATNVEYHGVVFLLFFDAPVPSLHYEPINWVTEQLKNTENKPIIVFHHKPEVTNFYKNKFYPPSWATYKISKWSSLLNSYNVIAEITGHFHRDELHWRGSVPIFIAPAAALGHQPSIRIYDYTDGKISYRTQMLE
ncbi:MAG: metallophosphoesterase [Deltaproteobacteria bacterium]|nr:metallophosphoesterase [Deltaproteobacteria bacterium]